MPVASNGGNGGKEEKKKTISLDNVPEGKF
jgi:hypothetical protein